MQSTISQKSPDPVADPRAKPWQFSLWHFFAVMAVVCVLGASYQWLGPGVILLVGLLLVVGCIGVAISRRKGMEILVVAGGGIALIWLMMPSLGPHRESARRSVCQINLKQIGIALHNYHDEYACFPPAYVADANGRPMHSWRVLLLPYIEEQRLYDRYNFNEPWDGPNNSKLTAEMPRIYRCPSEDQPTGSTDTSYLAVVGAGTIWHGGKGVSFRQVSDGTSNTLLVVESHGSGINWMEPRDLHTLQMPAAVNPMRGQGICSCHNHGDRGRGDGAHVLIADGSVRLLENNVSPKTVDAMLTIAGGETVTVP